MKNLKKIFSDPVSFVSTLLGVLIVAGIWYILTDFEVLWISTKDWFWREVVFQVLASVLFGLFVGATVYRIRYFSGKIQKKHTILGALGGLFSFMVTGCAACTFTILGSLLGVVGLAGVLTALPYNGYELKVIAILLLLYAVYSLLKNLEMCKIKSKTKHKKC